MPVLNPNSAALQEDPYADYALLRETEPVHWSGPFGRFLVTRYEDVRFAQRNQELFATAPLGVRLDDDGRADPRTASLATTFAQQILFLDPPDHTRLRKLVSRVFTPRAISSQAALVARLTRELLNDVSPVDEFDLIAELAGPLPLLVIAEMVGVPLSDRDQFRDWGGGLASLIEPNPSAEKREYALASADSMRTYLAELVESRRGDLGDDILSGLIAAEEEGNRLTADEIVGMVMILTSAGHETTTSLLANCVQLLVEDPVLLPQVSVDPAFRRTAIEEVLRFEPPIQFVTRVLTDEVTLHGVRMPAGSLVGLMIAAANRDPRVFDEPERFDAQRHTNPHLSFGNGIHVCIGASLARLEADIALETITRHYPTLRTMPDAYVRKPSATLHGFASLPARVGA